MIYPRGVCYDFRNFTFFTLSTLRSKNHSEQKNCQNLFDRYQTLMSKYFILGANGYTFLLSLVILYTGAARPERGRGPTCKND